MTASLVGTGTLARLAVRRDRVLLPVGILGITIFAVSSAKATLALYPTVASMDAGIKTIFASPSAVALYGPISDPTDPDALAVVKTTMFGAVLLAIFGYAVVRRHTRSEDEDGRFELVGAGVVGAGRRSPPRWPWRPPQSWPRACSPASGMPPSAWTWPAHSRPQLAGRQRDWRSSASQPSPPNSPPLLAAAPG